MHETEDNRVFQRFKERIAPEPHQVTRTLLLEKNLNDGDGPHVFSCVL